MKKSRRNKSIVQPVYNLLEDEQTQTPDNLPSSIVITSTPVKDVKISISQSKYLQKPYGKGAYGRCGNRHFTIIVKPVTTSLKKLLKKIIHGHLLRHYYDSEFIKEHAFDVSKFVHIKKWDLIYGIDTQEKAKAVFLRGVMKCNHLGTRKIIEKYCSFQAIFFDIDECPYPTMDELVSTLALKPNLVYESYSYSKGKKNTYHLVYIFDQLMSVKSYSMAYDLVHSYIRNPGFQFDRALRSPCQLLYGTSKKGKIYEKRYYHISSPVLQEFVIASEMKAPSLESKICVSDTKQQEGVSIFNCEVNVPSLAMTPWSKSFLLDPFIKVLMSRKGTKHFLKIMEKECIAIDYQCNGLNEPFVYCDDGLLAIKPFLTIQGHRKRIILRDGRKRRARFLTQLFMAMCPWITPEDLTYNVIRVLDLTCDWSAQPQHRYGNDVILSQIRESYFNVKNGQPEFKSEDIEKYRESKTKRKLNAYYYRRQYMNEKTYYWYWYADEVDMLSSNLVPDDELKRGLVKQYPNPNKGVPRSEISKEIIRLYKQALPVREIIQIIFVKYNKSITRGYIWKCICKFL